MGRHEFASLFEDWDYVKEAFVVEAVCFGNPFCLICESEPVENDGTVHLRSMHVPKTLAFCNVHVKLFDDEYDERGWLHCGHMPGTCPTFPTCGVKKSLKEGHQ